MERARFEGSAKVPPCRMVRLTVALHGGDRGENAVTYQLFMLQRFAWKIAEFFVSCGLAKPEDERIRMQWDRVEGAEGVCRVTQREFIKRSGPHAGETGTSNEIVKFLAPAAPRASVTPPAAAPAAEQLSWQKGAF